MGIFQQFPYSNFHEINLDQIIKIMREMQDEWAATKTEWASYKDFIDNYFANLDVSEEVLAALRTMAASGELNQIIDPTIATETAAWLALHISQPTTPAIDNSLTIAGAAADAKVTGDWIFPFMDDQPFDDYVDDVLDSGFWSTTNGQKYSSGSLKCTRSLIRVVSGGLYTCNYDGEYCMYDINKTFVGTRHIQSLISMFAGGVKLSTIPDNVAYIGINAPASATSIELHRVNTENTSNILTPFDADGYIYKDDFWATGSGVLNSTTSLSVIICANLPVGSRWYVSNNAGTNCVCIDSSGNALTPGKVFDAYSNGNIYTIPADTKITYFNIYNNRTAPNSNIKTDYITRITKTKKILTIGDSITWLEGTSAGGEARVCGYQRELRSMGYEVDKRAWSGYPYTNGVNTGDPTASIFNEVVTNNLDVSGYEYITVFGGLNDMLYSSPIGTAPAAYSDSNFDGNTLYSAISGILEYIRVNNPNAKIILVLPPKSEAITRPYNKAVLYNAAISECSRFWSAPEVDLFTDMNISPNKNFTYFFYDVTHPNYYGMRRIGTLIANKIKELYDGLVQ